MNIVAGAEFYMKLLKHQRVYDPCFGSRKEGKPIFFLRAEQGNLRMRSFGGRRSKENDSDH